MAVEIINVSNVLGDVYNYTVQDTDDVVGTDEGGKDVYQTYTARHNINNPATELKAKFEEMIAERLAVRQANLSAKAAVIDDVEAIDTVSLKGE